MIQCVPCQSRASCAGNPASSFAMCKNAQAKLTVKLHRHPKPLDNNDICNKSMQEISCCQIRSAVVQVFLNDTSTRTFIAVCPNHEHSKRLLQVVRTVDQVMLRHHLLPYYQPPRLHVSLCWLEGNVQLALESCSASLQQRWAQTCGSWAIQVPFCSPVLFSTVKHCNVGAEAPWKWRSVYAGAYSHVSGMLRGHLSRRN